MPIAPRNATGIMVAGILLLLSGLTAAPAAHDPITTKVTFSREIRAILAARCAACHVRGGSAPMPLTTYEEVRPWARAIKEQVLARRMPKWHAARGFGAFSNDRTPTPLEMALLISWIDGGLPQGDEGARVVPPAAAGGSDTDLLILVAPQAERGAAVLPEARWITGWSFEPGDPLISSASITSGVRPVGTWVAGDRPVAFPAGSAMRVAGPLRVYITRRPRTDFEQPVPERRSLLRVRVAEAEPERTVWVEQIPCGAPRTRTAAVLAVRPLLAARASARVWMQRPGAPASIVGWFRDFDPAFARTYWLARPLELSSDARIQADAPCELQLTLTAYR